MTPPFSQFISSNYSWNVASEFAKMQVMRNIVKLKLLYNLRAYHYLKYIYIKAAERWRLFHFNYVIGYYIDNGIAIITYILVCMCMYEIYLWPPPRRC